jgi:hypothetical protein
VPVPGGAKIACADLVDVAKFAAALKNPVELQDFTAHTRQKDASAVCKIIRTGARPDKEEQAKLLAKHGRLGVLPGDPYCEIRYYCSFPEQTDFEKRCVEGPKSAVTPLGTVPACVTLSQRGPEDAYRYRLVEPDTRCVLDIAGGPSAGDEQTVQACAQAAIDSATATSLDSYK